MPGCKFILTEKSKVAGPLHIFSLLPQSAMPVVSRCQMLLKYALAWEIVRKLILLPVGSRKDARYPFANGSRLPHPIQIAHPSCARRLAYCTCIGQHKLIMILFPLARRFLFGYFPFSFAFAQLGCTPSILSIRSCIVCREGQMCIYIWHQQVIFGTVMT